MSIALIAVPELMFRAKIKEAAAQAGRAIVVASNPDAVVSKAIELAPSLIIVDLGDERIQAFETIRRLKAEPVLASTRIVGFFSHVRTDLLEAGREAGCDLVMPRSAFVTRLPELLSAE